jgi:hypothetical protein
MVQIYDRSYTSLQDVLANIGGIVKMLNVIGYILNYFFFKFQIIKNTYYVADQF